MVYATCIVVWPYIAMFMSMGFVFPDVTISYIWVCDTWADSLLVLEVECFILSEIKCPQSVALRYLMCQRAKIDSLTFGRRTRFRKL